MNDVSAGAVVISEPLVSTSRPSYIESTGLSPVEKLSLVVVSVAVAVVVSVRVSVEKLSLVFVSVAVAVAVPVCVWVKVEAASVDVTSLCQPAPCAPHASKAYP
jgi:hypothetical protein